MGLFDKLKSLFPEQPEQAALPADLERKLHKTYACARCKKVITDSESRWVGNHRFCRACGMAAKPKSTPPRSLLSHEALQNEAKEAGYQAYMDYAKGSATPEEAYISRDFVKTEDGRWVYGKLMEQADTAYDPSEKTRAILDDLRQEIIKTIQKKPATNYQLASLLFQDARRCFGDPWDGAWFFLDLERGTLYANVSTYPDQFGGSRESHYTLSAAEFHQKANEFHFGNNLEQLSRPEDWALLFNDELKQAVAAAKQALQKQQEEQATEERRKYAIALPKAVHTRQPTMGLDSVLLALYQRYSNQTVTLTRQEGRYRITYRCESSFSSSSNQTYEHLLTPAEAVWVENAVQAALDNPNTDTWQSLPGGDTMTVELQQAGKKQVSLSRATPLNKYYDLLGSLRTLAKYGSKP